MVFVVTLTVVVRFANVRIPVPATSATDSANLDLKLMPTTATSVSIVYTTFADPGLHRRGSAEILFGHFVFKIFWRTQVLFMGPLIHLFWTSGDVSFGIQSQRGQPYSHLLEIFMIHSITFTSCVTPADLLVASMTADRSPYVCFSRGRMPDSVGDLQHSSQTC